MWTGCLFGLWRLMKSSQKLHFWFLSLKANLILDAKWNESDYKVRSLGLKRVGKWTMCPTTLTLLRCKPREVISPFNILLPLVVTAKSVKVYGLWKMFLPASTKVSNCYCWLKLIILSSQSFHIFFPRHPMVFIKSTSPRQF